VLSEPEHHATAVRRAPAIQRSSRHQIDFIAGQTGGELLADHVGNRILRPPNLGRTGELRFIGGRSESKCGSPSKHHGAHRRAREQGAPQSASYAGAHFTAAPLARDVSQRSSHDHLPKNL
jgi:hypothetical protein